MNDAKKWIKNNPKKYCALIVAITLTSCANGVLAFMNVPKVPLIYALVFSIVTVVIDFFLWYTMIKCFKEKKDGNTKDS